MYCAGITKERVMKAHSIVMHPWCSMLQLGLGRGLSFCDSEVFNNDNLFR